MISVLACFGSLLISLPLFGGPVAALVGGLVVVIWRQRRADEDGCEPAAG